MSEPGGSGGGEPPSAPSYSISIHTTFSKKMCKASHSPRANAIPRKCALFARGVPKLVKLHSNKSNDEQSEESVWGACVGGGAPQRSEILEKCSNVLIKQCAAFHIHLVQTRSPESVFFICIV